MYIHGAFIEYIFGNNFVEEMCTYWKCMYVCIVKLYKKKDDPQ